MRLQEVLVRPSSAAPRSQGTSRDSTSAPSHRRSQHPSRFEDASTVLESSAVRIRTLGKLSSPLRVGKVESFRHLLAMQIPKQLVNTAPLHPHFLSDFDGALAL